MTLAIVLSIYLFKGIIAQAQEIPTITVKNFQSGISTHYIGACEGNVNFDLDDLQDLGMNTYRIYGGMSRWEYEDDDGKYGLPSIAEIKTNPNIINWEWWNKVMINPPNGSDYWWSGSASDVWQGNAQTIFSNLKQANIRPILTIRNADNNWNPSWALQLNPPRTEEDWNEWWEHVFATVYWLNVRNDYQVNDFEIHNEPDNRDQGWGGTQADYFELVRVAEDAIDYVYKTYLPGRIYHIHAPTTVGGSRWPGDTLREIPTYFDSMNIHDYAADISEYTQKVHTWMNGTIHYKSPIWLGEWGTYTTGYDDLNFAINLIKNMIRGSQPGNNYIYGSHIFSLYDWGKDGGFKGILGANGKRSISYYALRMGIRALQGGRPTFLTSVSNPDLTAITTQDNQGKIDLLVTNSGKISYSVDTDISELILKGTGKIWEFSAKVMDEIVDNVIVVRGHASLEILPNAAILIEFQAD
ncbi:MAG: hypothetical protein WBA93_18130 [Microcoleaceae cyanobacterium]